MQLPVWYHIHNIRCSGSLILMWFLVPSATLESILGHETVNECVCPGDQLTYRCTVQGSNTGGTLWTGTAFSGCQQNTIFLQHHQFTPTGGPTGRCNKGAIVGRSLGVQGNNYTSEVNVTITPETAGKTIMCSFDVLDGQNITNKFTTRIPGQLPPPNKLFISTANFTSQHFTFSWSPVAPDCPDIHYNILASNCGSCPTTTNHTNVTCTDVPTENSVCTFAIQTVACGTFIGNESDPVIVHSETSQEKNNTDMCSNTAYYYNNLHTISSPVVPLITSVVVLAVALITSAVVFTTAIVIILQKNKAKIKKLQPPNRAGSSAHMEAEATYEDPLPSVSAISIKENVAYGHAKTSTAAM